MSRIEASGIARRTRARRLPAASQRGSASDLPASDRHHAKDLAMHHRSSPPRRLECLVFTVLLPAMSLAASGAPPAKDRPANRLGGETSPYLLLHAHNPVDWYPWGPEAFARARTENKPIFLSVGYSSCYWCHVMERESFEDAEIARVLNAHFVCIKVDREERPDVDQIYMTALQALGPAGWPMSMFLTPDGRPFFGGTYFPPRDREGFSGFLRLVTAVATAWEKQRAEIEKSADLLTEAARRRLQSTGGGRKLPLSRAWMADGLAELSEQFDPEYGGIGFNPQNPRRPKFPEPVNLVFLLDQHTRGTATTGTGRPDASSRSRKPEPDPLAMVLLTLDRMARGGIRDHLAGGYHRYSTDRSWTVPHFEKMLYDNAQLASAHLLAFEITKDPRWRDEAVATFAFIERSMTSPEGGFYSALDAETNHEEGAYYVWTQDEVKSVLSEGPDAAVFAQVYGLAGEPNFEGGRFVLREPRPRAEQAATLKTSPQHLETRLAPLRDRLLAAREKRPSPLRDDKILTSWNGLMIAAFADGYRVLRVDKYRRVAEKAADFLLARLRLPDGRLLRTFRLGTAKLPAYLEDYAFLAHALLKLHAATHDQRWLREARALADRMLADFEDREEGGFFFTALGHESLLARPKDPIDNALPSGNGIAILDLLALHRATGESSYREHAAKALGAFSTAIAQRPGAMPVLLLALEQYLDGAPAPSSAAPTFVGTPTPARDAVVTASARTAGDPAASFAPGQELDVQISVTIQVGWHIYANPTGVPDLKPTTIQLDRASERFATLVKVTYPAGEARVLGSIGTERISLYEGKVQVTGRLRLAETSKPGPIDLTLVLSYQACNDKLCQAPANLEIPILIPVRH
jgi:uncharacterized protein YyaL (SSP411 family)